MNIQKIIKQINEKTSFFDEKYIAGKIRINEIIMFIMY